MKPYRILFTGSRRLRDHRPIIEALDDVFSEWRGGPEDPVTFVHGAAPGCDRLVDQLAAKYMPWVAIERHPADWDAYGNAAGPKRNAKMVAAGADICLAFPCPQSRGTWDCARRAAEAGIPVRVYGVKP